MIFHILTIFPGYFEGPFQFGVVSRAIEQGLLKMQIHNLRDWTKDRHQIVDDRPFGGGEGMLLKPEPIFDAVESILPERSPKTRVILLSAQGRKFDQSVARSLASMDQLLLICGRYEGVDERVVTNLIDEEISIGDFVLSGGELAAAVLADSVARLIPGVLGNEASSQRESFSYPDEDGNWLLDCPHYTRPAVFRGLPVPPVLLGGNHKEIEKWRLAASREKRLRNRPDLVRPQQESKEMDRRETDLEGTQS